MKIVPYRPGIIGECYLAMEKDKIVLVLPKDEAIRMLSELTVLLDRFAPTPEPMPGSLDELENVLSEELGKL